MSVSRDPCFRSHATSCSVSAFFPSEILHEEEELEELRARVESTAARRAAARQGAEAAATTALLSGKKKTEEGAPGIDVPGEEASAVSLGNKSIGGRPTDAEGGGYGGGGGDDDLPIGFFDDEERDAEARGLVGRKKLKEVGEEAVRRVQSGECGDDEWPRVPGLAGEGHDRLSAYTAWGGGRFAPHLQLVFFRVGKRKFW